MKADCPNCAHYSPHPCRHTNGADGHCDNPRIDREVYDAFARNCDRFGFLAKSFEVDAELADKGRVAHG